MSLVNFLKSNPGEDSLVAFLKGENTIVLFISKESPGSVYSEKLTGWAKQYGKKLIYTSMIAAGGTVLYIYYMNKKNDEGSEKENEIPEGLINNMTNILARKGLQGYNFIKLNFDAGWAYGAAAASNMTDWANWNLFGGTPTSSTEEPTKKKSTEEPTSDTSPPPPPPTSSTEKPTSDTSPPPPAPSTDKKASGFSSANNSYDNLKNELLNLPGAISVDIYEKLPDIPSTDSNYEQRSDGFLNGNKILPTNKTLATVQKIIEQGADDGWMSRHIIPYFTEKSHFNQIPYISHNPKNRFMRGSVEISNIRDELRANGVKEEDFDIEKLENDLDINFFGDIVFS